MKERLRGDGRPENPEIAGMNEDSGGDRAEPVSIGQILPPPIDKAERVDSLTEAQTGDLIIVRLTDTGDGVNSGVVHAICQFDYNTVKETSNILYLGRIGPDIDQEDEMAVPSIDTSVLTTAFGYPADSGSIGRNNIFERRNSAITLGKKDFELETTGQDSGGNRIVGIYRSEQYQLLHDVRTLAIGISEQPTRVTSERWARALENVMAQVGEREIDERGREVFTLPRGFKIRGEKHFPSEHTTNEPEPEPKYFTKLYAELPDCFGTRQRAIINLTPSQSKKDSFAYIGPTDQPLLEDPRNTLETINAIDHRNQWTSRIRPDYADPVNVATATVGSFVAYAFMERIKEAQQGSV
jgi:hypothetical protein